MHKNSLGLLEQNEKGTKWALYILCPWSCKTTGALPVFVPNMQRNIAINYATEAVTQR